MDGHVRWLLLYCLSLLLLLLTPIDIILLSPIEEIRSAVVCQGALVLHTPPRRPTPFKMGTIWSNATASTQLLEVYLK